MLRRFPVGSHAHTLQSFFAKIQGQKRIFASIPHATKQVVIWIVYIRKNIYSETERSEYNMIRLF